MRLRPLNGGARGAKMCLTRERVNGTCTTYDLKYINKYIYIIGERSEPHTYRTVGKNLRHIYIYVFYIYIYIYTSVRRARAVNARATRKRRTGRLRFNGQYNRLENGYFSSKL